MIEKVDTPPDELPLSDALRDFARRTGANVLLDSTSLPTGLTVKPYSSIHDGETSGTRDLLLVSIAYQKKLTFDRTAVDTIEMWPLPDVDDVVNRIVAMQNDITAQGRPLWPRDGHESPDTAVFRAYLEDKRGWNATPATLEEQAEISKGMDQPIMMSELPPALLRSTKLALYQDVMNRSVDWTALAFERDFWKQSHVQLLKGFEPVWDDKGKEVDQVPIIFMQVKFPVDYERTDYELPFGVGTPRGASREEAAEIPKSQSRVRAENKDIMPLETANALLSTLDNRFELAAPTVPPAPGFDLSDGALQKQVSFDVERMALPEFVAQLSQQSGVKLQLAPDAPRDLTLIARSPGMTVSAAMAALTRLYGTTWSKTGDSYTLNATKLDTLQMDILRMGYRTAVTVFDWTNKEERDDLFETLATDIYQAIGPEGWHDPEGVAFTSLPTALQDRVLALFRQANAPKLIQSQQHLYDAMAIADDLQLKFGRRPAEPKQFFGRFSDGGAEPMIVGGMDGKPYVARKATFRAYTPDGLYVAWLFPSLGTEVPTEAAIEREKLRQGLNDQ